MWIILPLIGINNNSSLASPILLTLGRACKHSLLSLTRRILHSFVLSFHWFSLRQDVFCGSGMDENR